MKTLIGLDAISYKVESKDLFLNLQFAVEQGFRLGIVGPNGSGKSTLLKIMSGEIIPDSGRVITSRGLKIGYVPQLDNFKDSDSVEKTLIKNLDSSLQDYEASTIANKILSKVGFINTSQTISELSGGWRKRLSIAISLAQDPEVLLLDEPTNHLDLAGLIWLEEFLVNCNISWVLISHDRYFLEKTVTQILEISPIYAQGIFRSDGSYLDFIENKENYISQEKKRAASLNNKVKTELEWASKAPQGRGTKAIARINQANRLHSQLQEMKNRQRQSNLNLNFTDTTRKTKDLIEFKNVSFFYDQKKVLEKESFKITNGMCLGILGHNGQGKSTILKLIGEMLTPNSGEIKKAPNLKIIYFDQLRTSIQANTTVIEAISNGQAPISYQGRIFTIASWLKKFGFKAEIQNTKINQLSGGEQARILLAKLIYQEADVLILDEPTNDLDISMLEMLEKMLQDFSGATILVTHDRFMLEKVCTHYLGFVKGQKLLTFASYEQWQESILNNKSDLKEFNEKEQKSTWNESLKREYGQIENKIVKAEKNLEQLNITASLPETYTNLELSQKIGKDLKIAKQNIDDLYKRWQELDEIKPK